MEAIKERSPNRIIKDLEKKRIFEDILKFLEERPHSIVELQTRLNMKRSTLIYYLNDLERRNEIQKQRIEKKVTGRPTMIKLTENKSKQLGERGKKMKRYYLKILKKIKEEKEFPLDKPLLEETDFKPQDKKWVEEYKILLEAESNILYTSLVKKYLKLTKEGEDFLKKLEEEFSS